MVLKALLVLHHLAVELVNQLIDRGVQIEVGTFREQIAALESDIALCSLRFVLFVCWNDYPSLRFALFVCLKDYPQLRFAFFVCWKDCPQLRFVLFVLVFDRQQHFDVHHLVEMPRDAFDLADHITPQRRGHFQMMSANRQVHKTSPLTHGLR
mgnify:CR=1 FL=1